MRGGVSGGTLSTILMAFEQVPPAELDKTAASHSLSPGELFLSLWMRLKVSDVSQQ
jgi:hypothetical protein